MHMFRVHTSLIIALSGMLILSAAGCEDSASKQRDQVQARLTQLRTDLQKTLATGGESYEADLNKIVNELSSVTGGEPGQQAAKAILAANALREVAALHMNKAAAIEAQHRTDLGGVNARIEAAQRIGALASGLETIDAAKRRDELQADLQKAMDGVTAAQARMAELASPINERTTQNSTQKSEIERLRVQVGELLKQANIEGYSKGFETYKQATQVGRQADKIEYEVSNREIDLEHDLNPQHKSAEMQKAQLEALAQAIESAQAELDAFAKAAMGDAQASRAKVTEISKQIASDLAALKATADGELKASYDEGLAALEKASASANATATGGRDSAAGKTIGVAVNESIVRLHLMAAHGLADRQATLQRIKMSNGVVAIDGVDGQIKELADARQQHLDAAKSALEQANLLAQSIGDAGSEVAALQSSLQHLSDVLAGKNTPATEAATTVPPEGATSGDTASAAAPAMTIGAGAESPEALATALTSVKALADVSRLLDYAVPPTDAKTQALLQGMRTMADGMGTLDAALQSKFNKGVADIPEMGIAMTEELPVIAEATADAGASTIAVKYEDGTSATFPISQVNERWYVGAEGDDGAGMLGLLRASPEELAAMPSDVGQKLMNAMGNTMADLARRVQADEFASFDDFGPKAKDLIQRTMTQAMGLPAAAGSVDPNK